MNKKAWYIGIAALVIVIGTGCGQKPQAASPQGEQTVVTSQKDAADVEVENAGSEPVSDQAMEEQPEQIPSNGSVAGQEAPSSASSESTSSSTQSKSIDVFYTDPDQTGLVTAQKKISYTSELDKYTSSYKALQTSDSEALVPLWGKIQLLSVSFDQGVLALDITIPDTANLGSGGEMLALDALYQTFFQYKEVTAVEVLVDGQQQESLMGHMELEHPKMK